jgi:hypothetical protein
MVCLLSFFLLAERTAGVLSLILRREEETGEGFCPSPKK